MPFVLIIAFATSLGAHALALFGTDVDLSTTPEPSPIVVELLPLAKPMPVVAPKVKPAQKTPATSTARAQRAPVASASPVLSAPDSTSVTAPPAAEASTAAPDVLSPRDGARLPARGMIRYRVDRGDQGFEVGHSTHDWAVVDGAYRITAVTETSGLIALFKPLRIELESRGRLTPEGLQPEQFMIRRDGTDTSEKAQFDWSQMTVKIGNAASQPASRGAQDLLSFHYQLGFLPQPEALNVLPIATGKKYENYRLESLGDEEIDIPAGVFRTLHVRAPGDNTTELWLAYDYLLLPVKIRHTDRQGDSFVQVATEIRLSKD